MMTVELRGPDGGPDMVVLAAPPAVETAFLEGAERVSARIASGTCVVVPENEHRRLFFASRAAVFKNWDKPGKCQYPGCRDRSIVRSHTLQRGGPLTELRRQDGHVTTLEIDHRTERLIAGRKGLDLASTFPGFCSKHEAIFDVFESRATLTTTRDVVLQLYRSACREAVRLEFDVRQHTQSREQFEQLYDKQLRALVHAETAALVDQHPILAAYQISAPSDKDDRFNRWRDEARQDRDTIREMIVHLSQAMVAMDQGMMGAHFHRFILPQRLPITLSGQSVLKMTVGPDTHRVVVLLVVVPEADRTQVLIASPAEQGPLLDAYLKQNDLLWSGEEADPDALVALIERFLLYGTDHWFMENKFWNDLPVETRARIIEEADRRDVGVNDVPPITVLPRPAAAVRVPLHRAATARAALRERRRKRGWREFESLDERLARRLISARKRRQCQRFRDSCSSDIHVVDDGGATHPRWAFVRAYRTGQWCTPWRRMKWSQIEPFSD